MTDIVKDVVECMWQDSCIERFSNSSVAAGISTSYYGHIIQCYGFSEEEAITLRDAVFHALQYQRTNPMTTPTQEIKLLDCPFCGHSPDMSNLMDSLHPTGIYAHWMNPDDHDEGLHYTRNPEGAVYDMWEFNCLTTEGGLWG